jgi:serine/threonine-protein phosphatase PGAM5
VRRSSRLRQSGTLILGLLLCAVAQGGQETPGEPAGAHARTLYLVRHGAYSADPEVNPKRGPGISPLGVAQARLLASRLAGMRIRFDTITSSTMTRALETASVIQETLPDVPLAQSASLNECAPPTFRSPAQPPAREAACAMQLEAAYTELFTPPAAAPRHDVIAAHGNVIRYLVMKALGADTRAWLGMSLAHASLTVIHILADGTTVVMSVGDVGHIPENLQSWGGYADPELVVPGAETGELSRSDARWPSRARRRSA